MNINTLAAALRNEQVIAYPTESVFGLGCNPYSERAVKILLKLKQRPIEKGLIVIAHNLELLKPFIDEQQLTEKHWQKITALYDHPISWIVPSKTSTPAWLTGKFDSIAIRLCRHPAVAELCQQTQFALTSTSANLSGQVPCRTVEQVRLQFGADFPVLAAAVGNAQNPSEIRDIFTDTIIRNG